MKKIVSLLGIFALCAASFTACNKVTENDIQEKGKHIIKVTPVMAETRTVLDESGNTISVKWADSDVEIDPEGNSKFHVWENRVKGLAEATLNQDNTIATITCAFDENTSTNLVYSSCFAKQLDDNGNPVILEFQNPGSSSFDPDADLLIGEDITKTSQPDELLVNFSRPVALVKMTLKGLEVGESVTSVFVTSKSGKMTGVYNRANGEFDFTNGEETIVVCPTGVTVGSDGTAPVYFVSAPVDNATLEIEVWTSKGGATSTEEYHYKKEFTKGISFPANKLTRFTANVTGCEVVPKYYTKVTSDDDIVAGDYLIVFEAADEASVLSGVANDIGTVAEATIEDGDKIAQAGNEAYNIVVEEAAVDGVFTMKFGEQYLAYTLPAGTKKYNNLFLVDSADEDGAEWILSVDGIQNAYNQERYLQFNSDRFACYSSTQQAVSLYLLEGSGHSSGKLPVTLSFNPATIELALGDAFTAPTLTTNPTGLSVTYASDNDDVASVVNANTGEVSIVGVGTANITATFAGNDEYKAGSAYYTITVNPAPAVLTLPFAESFTESTGTMGWTGGVASGTLVCDNEGWDVEWGYGADGAARFGKSSSGLGIATTPEIHYGGNATLTFKAGAWNASSESTNLKLSVSSGSICKDVTLAVTTTTVTLVKGSWTEYTLYLKDLENPFTLTFEGNGASNSRFFLDEISIVEGIEAPDPEFGASMANTEAVSSAGGTKTISVSGNVAWSASATNGATVNPQSGIGVGTVTVTIPENTDSQNEASYVVTVSTEAEITPNSYAFTITQNAAPSVVNTSTEADPYTPSEAVTLAGQLDANGTLSDVYVAGIISQITDEYNAQFNNVSFNISADGLTTGDQLKIFRMPATSANDFRVGDALEYKGTLKNYSSSSGNTPELVADFTKVYQYHAPSFSVAGGEYTSAQTVELQADQGAVIYYTIDGTVPTTSSSEYSSAINVSSTTTIKAFAVKNGVSTGVVSATYTISSTAYTLFKTFTASGIGSGYGAHTNVSSDGLNWTVTFGQNTYIGTNSSNKSKCKLGDTYAKVGTPCGYDASTTQVAAVISESTLADIGKVEVGGDTDSYNPTKISLVYSADNTTYTLVETQDYSKANGNTFLFDAKSAGYYAVVLYYDGNSYMRTNDLKIKFYKAQ